MSTTEKLNVGRVLFLERLNKAMEKAPDARMGQLVVEALVGAGKGVPDDQRATMVLLQLLRMEDVSLVELIEKHVLTRK